MRPLALGVVLGCLALACVWVRADDVDLLKKANIATDNAGLLAYLRERTLSNDDLRKVQAQLERLQAPETKDRDDASKQLQDIGPRALGLVRVATEFASDKEHLKRLDDLRIALEKKADPTDRLSAVARLLAQRRPDGGLKALLDYLPACSDDLIEEETLALVAVAEKQLGKSGPLVAALKDEVPARRALAAYAVGRFLGPTQRVAILALIDDASPVVRRRALEGLIGKSVRQAMASSREGDAKKLKDQSLTDDEPSLLAFLKGRTRSPQELEQIKTWIRELGSPDFRMRDRASIMLMRQGPAAMSFLQDAELNGDPETQRRAYLCQEEIRRGPGPDASIAAVRLLAQTERPAEVLPILLAYVPFVDDDTVADEVHRTMTIFAARLKGAPSLLEDALKDDQPARRAAAAIVLGRVGTPEQVASLLALQNDPDATVRLRVAEGRLAASETSAVASLIDVLPMCPPQLLWHIEEPLLSLAGEKAPAVTMNDTAIGARAKAKDAWLAWHRKEAASLDLSRLHRGDLYQGLITICEYDGVARLGQAGSKIWQRSRDGGVRWSIEGLMGPMAAQVLPNGHVLIAENSGNRVIERDLKGNVLWEFRPQGNPIACQRLPNGNTFIATYNNVSEVTPDKKVVYSYAKGPAFYLFSAERTRDGKIVCLTAQGQLIELDAATGNETRNLKVINAGGWCSVQALPNSRYLIAAQTVNGGMIKEIDAENKTLWQTNVPGVFRAIKLPNGNILAASMTTRKVSEIDRDGRTRWEVTCQGRPWGLQYR